jgi:diadenosine tetraphosphate (Ap4A) HIT family hydrolase
VLYREYLKTVNKCPFCEHIKQVILLENENAILTYAIAPYHKYHLLVIPKRHVEHIKDLEWHELISITALLSSGIKALDRFGHDDCSIVVKDKYKTVPHLHYHIVPGGDITDISLDTEVRKMLTDKEEKELVLELKNQFNHIG